MAVRYSSIVSLLQTAEKTVRPIGGVVNNLHEAVNVTHVTLLSFLARLALTGDI